MIYRFDLTTTSLLAGLFLILLSMLALVWPAKTQASLKSFPRSKGSGYFLLTIAVIWSWLLIAYIDLGEFSNWRTRILVLIPVAYALTLVFVDEFLAVRALGMLALLMGEPLLNSAWLRPEPWRLLLVVLAYLGIIFGLFWIGMPYTLRNQIDWLTQKQSRLKAFALSLFCYGVALIIIRLTLHRPV